MQPADPKADGLRGERSSFPGQVGTRRIRIGPRLDPPGHPRLGSGSARRGMSRLAPLSCLPGARCVHRTQQDRLGIGRGAVRMSPARQSARSGRRRRPTPSTPSTPSTPLTPLTPLTPDGKAAFSSPRLRMDGRPSGAIASRGRKGNWARAVETTGQRRQAHQDWPMLSASFSVGMMTLTVGF